MKRTFSLLAVLGLFAGCSSAPEPARPLTVAAAANLDGVLSEVSAAFEAASGSPVTISFGSTANLAHQIENGAPFDLYLAADVAHVQDLADKALVGSPEVFALGKLVVWTPSSGAAIASLDDLARNDVRYVSVAKPELAPYGQAAVRALRAAGLWERVEPKVVYAQDVRMAKQFAASGNADAAMTALSVTLNDGGRAIEVPADLYHPIEQALGVVQASQHKDEAERLARYILSDAGQFILRKYGYDSPSGVR